MGWFVVTGGLGGAPSRGLGRAKERRTTRDEGRVWTMTTRKQPIHLNQLVIRNLLLSVHLGFQFPGLALQGLAGVWNQVARCPTG